MFIDIDNFNNRMCDYELFFMPDGWIRIDDIYYPICINALKYLDFFNTITVDCTEFEFHEHKPIIWKSTTDYTDTHNSIPYCTINTFSYMYENIKNNIIPYLEPKIILSTNEIVMYLHLVSHVASKSQCRNMVKWIHFYHATTASDELWKKITDCKNITHNMFFSKCDKQIIATNVKISDEKIFKSVMKFLHVPVVSRLNFWIEPAMIIYRKSTHLIYTVSFSSDNTYHILINPKTPDFKISIEDEIITIVGKMSEKIYVPFGYSLTKSINYRKYIAKSLFAFATSKYSQKFDDITEDVYQLQYLKYENALELSQ